MFDYRVVTVCIVFFVVCMGGREGGREAQAMVCVCGVCCGPKQLCCVCGV